MVLNIEHRKVQQTGGSSFIISLPKEWIVKHGVKKNDTLGIIAQPDGNLLVTPKIESEDVDKIKKIDITKITEYDFLFRLLIGTYIMGFSKVELESEKKITASIRDCIVKFTQIAIGPEIVEESNNRILIKDLLNPKEMPFDKTIKRMYIIVEDMHKSAIRALMENDKKVAENVIKKDNDIDRLHWLIGRQSHIVLRDIILAQKMGITLEEANHYQKIGRLLERIGDHAVKIAKNVLAIIDDDIVKDLKNKIEDASKTSLELLSKSLDAWLQKDILLANSTIEDIKELVESCEKIQLNPRNGKSMETFIAISYIVESIRRTGEYAGDICEIIINNLINTEK